MIVIIGDTHGDIDFGKVTRLQACVERGEVEVDYLIICGDFGFIWSQTPTNTISNKDKQRIDEYFGDLPWVTLFIDGNHDNHDILQSLPTKEKFGGKVSEILPNLYYVKRGSIIELDGKSFLCIGGAASQDKDWRIIYEKQYNEKIWWEKEIVNDGDINTSLENLKNYNNTVDYVVSHTCPTPIAILALNSANEARYYYTNYKDKVTDPSCDRLYCLQQKLTYKEWFFGHFHIDKRLSDTFKCVYNDFIFID